MRDWAPRENVLFGRGLTDKERRSLRKQMGICLWSSCRNKAEDGLTTCRACRIKKKEVLDRYRLENKEHVNKQAQKYRKPYSEEQEKRLMSNRYTRIKSQFGWDKDRVNAMLVAQGYVCAICGQPNPNGNNLGLDHDHKTGIPREFLCHRCNSALGYVDDDVKLLEDMITYLNKHNENPNEIIPYKTKNISGYRGVEKNHNKWVARAMINKKRTYLGNFNTPEEAYQVYKSYTENARS
jgi:hypothetical protein